MSEETPVRRRRRQAVQTQEQPPQAPQTTVKTVRVVADEAQPEWMVSASQVSGAASRRAGKQESAAKPRNAQKAPAVSTVKAGYVPANEPQDGSGAQARSVYPQEIEKPRAVSPRPKASARPAGTKSAPAKKNTAKRASGSSRKVRERRAKAAKRTAIVTLSALVLLALIVVAFMGGSRLLQIKQTLDRGDGVFYPNLFVNDIPLEGRTLDEAASAVTQQVVSLVSSWKITLRTQDGRSWEITGDDLNMKYNVADQLDQLWAIGHTGSSAVRYEQVKALEETPVMRYTTLSYDLTKVNQILTNIKSEIDMPAVSATRVSDETKWPPFSYTDDIPGQSLDITGLNEQICGMVDRLESGDVYLTPTPVQAAVTRAYLEGQIVELATYDTSVATSSKPGRFINIRVATEKFSRLTIKPNEVVSFNKVTGLRTYANGYADAPELARGEYVDGVGGGVCQVSSTLYNAVVNAGLQVKNRVQHSLPSSYVPLGLDATVQDNRLDFTFINNTNSDIYISSEYYQSGRVWHCRFTIHGRPDPNGYSYRLESTVRETIPRLEPVYRPDTEAKYVVYDDETPYQTSKGEEGYVVDVYLVTTDKNGLEVSRVLDHTDTYNATAPVYYVGVTPRETPVPNIY